VAGAVSFKAVSYPVIVPIKLKRVPRRAPILIECKATMLALQDNRLGTDRQAWTGDCSFQRIVEDNIRM
jgi:hypothetical protein